jgi:hypothetical protein
MAFGDMVKRSPPSGRLVAVRPVATRKASCTRASGRPWGVLDDDFDRTSR